MPVIRRLLAQRRLAALLCAVTLALKLLVPTGYMIDGGHGRVTVSICSGTGPMTMTMPMPGHGKPADHKAEQPCAFAGLSAATLDTVDPIQLAALLAFVAATGRAATLLPAPSRAAHLRPPPRGPPATA